MKFYCYVFCEDSYWDGFVLNLPIPWLIMVGIFLYLLIGAVITRLVLDRTRPPAADSVCLGFLITLWPATAVVGLLSLVGWLFHGIAQPVQAQPLPAAEEKK